MRLEVLGFSASDAVGLPSQHVQQQLEADDGSRPGPSAGSERVKSSAAHMGAACRDVPGKAGAGSSEVSVEVQEAAEPGAQASVYVRHSLDEARPLVGLCAGQLCACIQTACLQECGSHLLAFSCALWVYNMSGVDIALQPGVDDQAMPSQVGSWPRQPSHLRQESLCVDPVLRSFRRQTECPRPWIKPYQKGSSAVRPTPTAGALSQGGCITPLSSAPSLQGLSQLPATADAPRFRWPHALWQQRQQHCC